jgi:glycerol-3-phosphate cytidylyltransferase
MKRVLTYGTFDLMHYGHIELLRRAKELGNYLVVALSSDEFNAIKGKKSHFDYAKRKDMLSAIKYVDKIIPEHNWQQKRQDIKDHKIDIMVMGDDWTGKFDDLSDACQIVYLPRTPNISSTAIKTLHKVA